MIRFESDYLEGCHENILKALIDTNYEQTAGYGSDPHTENAKDMIKALVGDPEALVHLAVGGTQTNKLVIQSLLGPFDGVVCADTGHINVHEGGAIESTGHKVISLPNINGKIEAKQLDEYMASFYRDAAYQHWVRPRAVYISQTTEYGTVYKLQELKDLYAVCKKYQMKLFVDGARLGYGLLADDCDMTIRDLYQNCDVFYIGGTKVGAMFGEAIVYRPESAPDQFFTMAKQNGAFLAKGRLLGIQFEELLRGGEDSLYYQVSKHADDLAIKIRDAFTGLGYKLYYESGSNQQFIIMPLAFTKKLDEKYTYDINKYLDNETVVVRFCTSWCTKEENVDELIADVTRWTKG